MQRIKFIDENATFEMKNPQNESGLYFPIASEDGYKGCLTPELGGDAKVDQNHFLLEPVSIENLHNNRSSRNFWVVCNDLVWSATGNSCLQQEEKFKEEQEQVVFKAGLLWQSVTRNANHIPMQAQITSFATRYDKIEIMCVKLTNIGEKAIRFLPYAAVPIFGRSADNLRDHRHVTSLLHTITTKKEGVYVTPTLSFDERGHQKNEYSYAVCGIDAEGNMPCGFFPTIESFIGEGGNLEHPKAVYKKETGSKANQRQEGFEAMGAFCFTERELKPKESATYYILMGLEETQEMLKGKMQLYLNAEYINKEYLAVKKHWNEKVNLGFYTKDKNFDALMHWISFQPELRRLFGCSFLPHHDYGKGGRGWRDLWQDCLALLLMNPSSVGKQLLCNFDGVRLDGTNATIIGQEKGEFLADRNHIARVWMDHAMWPMLTTKLYIDQTGDIDLLQRECKYFKDEQKMRGTKFDSSEADKKQGNWQLDEKNSVYQGSVLEHLLLELLCAFYEVGTHNFLCLRNADWNDALDMAKEHGESVAFSSAYAKNMIDLSKLLENLKDRKQIKSVKILKEATILLRKDENVYDDMEQKRIILKEYMSLCKDKITGETIEVALDDVIADLKAKANWMLEHIRKNEWVTDEQGNGWFNGYYDNHKNRLEGLVNQKPRMMLTSQVFSIMSNAATKEQVEAIIKSADLYLYQKELGGYRLNTNFEEVKTDMGRMFGFAYGEKENGAVFSHMAVMYAYALYERGFAKEGYYVLKSLKDQSLDFEKSHIYPGIPEYFNQKGRGLYHYLTGAASWFLLTMVTKSFGVSGDCGDLTITPKLLEEQFDVSGEAKLTFVFQGKSFELTIENKERKEVGNYKIVKVCGIQQLQIDTEHTVRLKQSMVTHLNLQKLHKIRITLG